MDKKSFIRGFGIGVIFTVFILGVSCLIRTSDSETISRAKKIGMVFKSDESKIDISYASTGSSIDTANNKTDNQSDYNQENKTDNKSDVNQNNTSKDDKSSNSTDKSGNMNKEEYDEEKKKLEKKSEDIKKNLVINDGDWSGKVSRELQELGVVDSASSFDRYLMDNGYSNRINSGTYEVSPDDTFEEIAKKITSGFKNRNER